MEAKTDKINQDLLGIIPFREKLDPIIKEVLLECAPQLSRNGTILVPFLMVWFVLTMAIYRHLDYSKVMSKLIKKEQWHSLSLPARIITTAAISYARRRLGVKILGLLFKKLVQRFIPLKADFYGYVSMAFDGVVTDMPDTEKNTKKFKKPSNDKKEGGYPVIRIMTLMVLSSHFIIDLAFAPYQGKHTGEQTLMLKILKRFEWVDDPCLFLFDAIFYSFPLMQIFEQNHQRFLMKVSSSITLRRIKGKTFSDGSYLAQVTKRIADPEANTQKKRKRIKHTIIVRVIYFQVTGFPPATLITNFLDPSISAEELIIQYHKRWDIEIAYFEIKTIQCATMKGQTPTIFRSKLPLLVIQELYAVLISYNMTRLIINQAVEGSQIDALEISFLDSLQWIYDASDQMEPTDSELLKKQYQYLLKMISQVEIDRPRRPRKNPRTIKKRRVKFKPKRKIGTGVVFDFQNEFKVLFPPVGHPSDEETAATQEEDYFIKEAA